MKDEMTKYAQEPGDSSDSLADTAAKLYVSTLEPTINNNNNKRKIKIIV
jgi:hypothetical protein